MVKLQRCLSVISWSRQGVSLSPEVALEHGHPGKEFSVQEVISYQFSVNTESCGLSPGVSIFDTVFLELNKFLANIYRLILCFAN